jgi:FkbM family methyltransferase
MVSRILRNLGKVVLHFLPFKQSLFRLLRIFGVPKCYRSLRFEGRFKLAVTHRTYVLLNCYDTYGLETEYFWRGITAWECVSIQIWIRLCQYAVPSSGGVICDIGASEGVYALVAKAVSRGAKVIAAEPFPEAYKRLRANVALNRMEVTALEVAVGRSNGKSTLFTSGEGFTTEASTCRSESAAAGSRIPIVTRSLDSLIEELHLPAVHLIKIDVEGAESDVIIGFAAYLNAFRPVVLVEILSDRTADELNRLLEAHGYCYWDINDDDRNGALGIRPAQRMRKGICLNWLLVPAEKVPQLQHCWADWILSRRNA